ncbi:MAG: hypothetical protein KI790_21320 [Cyclobacteriaceae bacterium]|nr:hypothetical protein [Cyclobacteriaceae bacterium HetDA_MAG_MS6]
MQKVIDFTRIVQEAWEDYDRSRQIKAIEDLSPKVSTNNVYRILFEDGGKIIAKLSYFGKFDHFLEDHTIINALANNLPEPFENFLAKSLTKYGQLFTYRYTDSILDAWVVFYNPIQIDQRPDRLQIEENIVKLGQDLASFHKACTTVRNTLPPNFKQTHHDVDHLVEILGTEQGQFEHRSHIESIRKQCDLFYENVDRIGLDEIDSIPVFVDWNIGNFSVNSDYRFFSRWDYDWFRMSSRVMDFYFFSRVCSSIGDRTVFSYRIDPLMENRFLIFLKSYHEVYPLTAREIKLLKEAYRFFILNYVIKDGRYFFHEIYATRLQQEAHTIYFPQLEEHYDEDRLLKALDL